MLDGLNIRTGITLSAVADASLAMEAAIGHPLPSRYVQAYKATHGVASGFSRKSDASPQRPPEGGSHER